MQHFSAEKWVDFSRSMIREDERTAMQEHLNSGCAACSKEMSLWQSLQRLAERERAYQPPQDAVLAVRVAFANIMLGSKRSARSEFATLLFDSFRTPQLAGARSYGSDSRHLLYGTGTYRIDARIQPQVDPEKVVLVGQVLNSADPHERLSAVPVTLLKGRRVLAESVTSQFGEFQIECTLEAGLRLSVTLPNKREISLPLIEPALGRLECSPHPIDNKTLRIDSPLFRKASRIAD